MTEAGEPTLREAILAQRKLGKSEREILQSDLLKDLIGASADLIDDSEALGPDPDMRTSEPDMPRAGAVSFGRWFQSEGHISLELHVEAARARDIVCAVSVGFLDIRLKEVPLLSGRLAQPVFSEVDWLLDETSTGEQLLCVELTKRERIAAVDSGGGFGVPLFESLRVRDSGGEAGKMIEVFEHGLVAGRYLPLEEFRSELSPEDEDPLWESETPWLDPDVS